LFVNLDEFTEHPDMETAAMVKNILTFYCLNCTLYFRDFAGMITAVAAAFSFGRMVRSNELVAVMASGISLKRIIAPIVFLALLLTGVLIVDQELLILLILLRELVEITKGRFVGTTNDAIFCFV